MSDRTTEAKWKSISLRHYQSELIQRLNGADRPPRAIVSWPTGSGKSAAFSAAVGALREKRDTARVLVVAPPYLLVQWQDQLRHFAGIDAFVMTPQAYRLLQVETSRGANVWNVHSCVVVSDDFLKQEDRIAEVIATQWDMVILDESHRGSAASQRGNAFRMIWQDDRIPLVVASSSLVNSPDWLTSDARAERFIFSYAQAIQEGIVPRRTTSVVAYELSESERWNQTHIRDLWSSETEERRSSFFQTLLMRRLDSSLYAFEQTMRRLIAKESIIEAESESEMETTDDLEDDAIPQAISLNREVGEQIVAALENERSDSKWEACHRLLQSRGVGDKVSGIIFTEFADTAEYLSYLVSSRGWTSFLITGAQTMEEREVALNRAREEKGWGSCFP